MNLVIENLTKTYSNKVKALDNISLKIGKGMGGVQLRVHPLRIKNCGLKLIHSLRK